MKQMTDDSINTITALLADYLQIKYNIDLDDDKNYDELCIIVDNLLSPYSNGYMNYN